MSFKFPTSIVCASDITVKPSLKATKMKLLVGKDYQFHKNIFGFQEDPLVSLDHLGTTRSVIVDANFIDVIDTNLLKMVIWYDNEWGYSNRVADIAKFIYKKR